MLWENAGRDKGVVAGQPHGPAEPTPSPPFPPSERVPPPTLAAHPCGDGVGRPWSLGPQDEGGPGSHLCLWKAAWPQESMFVEKRRQRRVG